MRNQVADELIAEMFEHRDASVIRMADGSSMRRILPGGRTTPIGMMTSRKVGRPLFYEARGERAGIAICESDPAVVSYLTQPHRLDIKDGRRLLTYYPDNEVRYACGRVEIIEHKRRDDRRLKCPAYMHKLDVAAEIYEALGWSFRIVFDEDLLDSSTVAVAKIMWASRFATVSDLMTLDVMTALTRYKPCRSNLIEMLGGDLLGESRLDALAIRRICTWEDFLQRSGSSICRPVAAREAPVRWC